MSLRKTLLAAKTDREAQALVGPLRDLVCNFDQAHIKSTYDDLLRWTTRADVICFLHPVVIIALLRLSYLHQDGLRHWQLLVEAARVEFSERPYLPASPEELLRGLL